MSLISQVVLLYALIGLGVAGALWLRTPARPGWFQTAAALPFWPIYLAILLSRPDASDPVDAAERLPVADGMAAAIDQVLRYSVEVVGPPIGSVQSIVSFDRG